ncbi:MAG: CopD family protein [Polyangiaceae bacterium]|nr:CopD family protein [Polyangiaceae bacterium]
MHAYYVSCVAIHVLAAALWVGGMGFFALVIVPGLRRLEESKRREILRDVGARFAKVGFYNLGTLVVTGIGNLAFREMLASTLTVDFWKTPFGSTLAIKLLLVVIVCALTYAHYLDALREGPESPADRARASWLGRSTMILSIVIAVLGVMLVRGAPW